MGRAGILAQCFRVLDRAPGENPPECVRESDRLAGDFHHVAARNTYTVGECSQRCDRACLGPGPTWYRGPAWLEPRIACASAGSGSDRAGRVELATRSRIAITGNQRQLVAFQRARWLERGA